jgi:hypothetical protein
MTKFANVCVSSAAVYSLFTAQLPQDTAFAAVPTGVENSTKTKSAAFPEDRLPTVVSNSRGSLEPGAKSPISMHILGAERAEVLDLINPRRELNLSAVTNVTYSTPVQSNGWYYVGFVSSGASNVAIDKGTIIYTSEVLPWAMTFTQVNGQPSNKFFALQNVSMRSKHRVATNNIASLVSQQRDSQGPLTHDELEALTTALGAEARLPILLNSSNKTIHCSVSGNKSNSVSVPVDIKVGTKEIHVRYCGSATLNEGRERANVLHENFNKIVSDKAVRFALSSSHGVGFVFPENRLNSLDYLIKVSADGENKAVPFRVNRVKQDTNTVTYEGDMDLGNGGVRSVIATVSATNVMEGSFRILR